MDKKLGEMLKYIFLITRDGYISQNNNSLSWTQSFNANCFNFFRPFFFFCFSSVSILYKCISLVLLYKSFTKL